MRTTILAEARRPPQLKVSQCSGQSLARPHPHFPQPPADLSPARRRAVAARAVAASRMPRRLLPARCPCRAGYERSPRAGARRAGGQAVTPRKRAGSSGYSTRTNGGGEEGLFFKSSRKHRRIPPFKQPFESIFSNPALSYYCTSATACEKRPVFNPVASYWRLVPPVKATRLATIAV